MTFSARIVVVALQCAACGRVGFDAANSNDATSNDASANDAAARCLDRPGALFCDDFEGPNLDAWEAQVGPVLRQTTIVHGGAAALQTSSNAAHVGSAVSQPLPAIVGGSLHTRAWFYVPSGFPIVKLNLIDHGNATIDGILFLFDMNELRAYAAPPPGAVVTTGIAVPRDSWFCIELHTVVAGTATGSIAIDLDGAEIGRADAIATRPTGNIDGFTLGPSFVDPTQNPVTIYIDDVVTGTQPIGCS